MALGKRTPAQQPLFIVTSDLPRSMAHPFYVAVNRLLAEHDFDPLVERICSKFYAEVMGRPSLPPGVYFRCLLIGYFEGLDSERGIAWRAADSLSLREYLGVALNETSPDHSTISRTRRLIDQETHEEVFRYVLKILVDGKLIDGKTVGVDSTTLEANAALRSIVRRDSGESYQEFLTKLAKASGIQTPTREDLAKIDRERKNKGNNDDWQHPGDPDAKIARMKDGTTHLAHKAEHAVDMESGAILAVTLQDASASDAVTLLKTVEQAAEQLQSIREEKSLSKKIHPQAMSEVVADKGCHSIQTLVALESMPVRTYLSEPRRGRRDKAGRLLRNWKDKPQGAKEAFHANRRRIRSERGKRLMRRRGELIERSFAHAYETGAMRRLYLRHRDNITKRVLIHIAGFNLALMIRKVFGLVKPRGLADTAEESDSSFYEWIGGWIAQLRAAVIVNNPWSTWRTVGTLPMRLNAA